MLKKFQEYVKEGDSGEAPHYMFFGNLKTIQKDVNIFVNTVNLLLAGTFRQR